MSLALENGQLVPEDHVLLPVNSVSNALGLVVFEAMRFYTDAQGSTRLFRFNDHVQRLRSSLALIDAKLDFDTHEILQGIRSLITENGCQNDSGYLKWMVYWPQLLAGTSIVPLSTMIPRWTIYLRPAKKEFLNETGRITCATSIVRRAPEQSSPASVKISANYFNSRLGLAGALRNGYDNAIFLGTDGFVAEAAESNVFAYFQSERQLITPSLSEPILPGITRASLLSIAREIEGIRVEERPIRLGELITADEVFLSNTAQLVRTVTAIDGRPIGGGSQEMASHLRKLLVRTALGEENDRDSWLTEI